VRSIPVLDLIYPQEVTDGVLLPDQGDKALFRGRFDMFAKFWGVKQVGVLAIGLGLSAGALVQAAQGGALAQSVRVPQGVRANGQPLPAGTYTLRVSSEAVTPVVGQAADSARWVEFVQGGQVRGKELASVVAPADVKAVTESVPSAASRGVVHALRGNEYVRIWVNEGGTQYLVHLVAGR
jgi:hypothetical protein